MKIKNIFHDIKNYRVSFFLFSIFLVAVLLRAYNITSIPRGLYVDEASVAYNAYQILTTGKDEHGVVYPFAFQAFGEYKMPVFIYMTSGSLALFGKNEFAIRIPSVFFGSITVIVFYFLAKELMIYEKSLGKKQKEMFVIISALLFAISPVFIQFSRAGFEAIVALFFFLVGFLLFFIYLRKKYLFLSLLSFFFLVLSMYTYNAFRVIGFVTALLGGIFLYNTLPKERRKTIIVGILAVLLALPMMAFSFTHAGQARFVQVTTFSDIHHMAIFLYPLQYINNYLSHFSFAFLFSYGDEIGRHTVFRMGALFKWEIVFLIAGIYFLVTKKVSLFTKSILFLLLVSPLAASLALPSPHLLRALLLVVPITLIVGYGITQLWNVLGKKKYIFFAVVLLFACFEFFSYLDLYYDYSAVKIPDWGGQYKELLVKLHKDNQANTIIVINNNVGMSYVYQKFYYPNMKVLFVDDTWTKPSALKNTPLLYVTTTDTRAKNTYLHLYPHAYLDTLTTPDKYHVPLYTIWRI